VKTNRAHHGFALAVTFAIVAACGGSQGTAILGDDGGVLEDTGTGPRVDTGTQHTPDTGTTTTPDTGTTTVDSGGTPDTGVPPTDTGTGDTAVPPSGDAGGACPSSCTTDSDCQATCPAVPMALNCCDTVTSACFTSASAQCPDQTSTSADSGSSGY